MLCLWALILEAILCLRFLAESVISEAAEFRSGCTRENQRFSRVNAPVNLANTVQILHALDLDSLMHTHMYCSLAGYIPK
eukprot:SAG25_NODE_469_length_7669_cov_4.786262_2_plen_80_part_00